MFNIANITHHQFLTLLEDYMQDNLITELDLETIDSFLTETFEFNRE